MNSQQILELRRKLGLNQTQFWSRVCVTQSGGCRYEKGKTIPNPVKQLLKMAYGKRKEADALFEELRFEKPKGGSHGK